MRGHFIGVTRHYHLMRPQRFGCFALRPGGRERHHICAHCIGQLDAHMAQPADTHDADLVSRPHLPVTQRGIRRNPCAEQRCDCGELRFVVPDAQNIALMHHDLLRIAAQSVTGRVSRRPVIRADHVVAIVLQPFVAICAVPATVNDAANSDELAHLEARHICADRRNTPDDFVSRHTGKQRASPLGAYLMDVGMADTTERDVDFHVVRARRAADDVHRFKSFVAGIGSVCFDRHDLNPRNWLINSPTRCRSGTSGKSGKPQSATARHLRERSRGSRDCRRAGPLRWNRTQ